MQSYESTARLAWPAWAKVVDHASNVLGWVASVLVLIMVIQVGVNALSRTFLNVPLPGTLAFVGYWWMPAIVFFGLALTQSRDEHIRVTLLIDGMSPSARHILDLVAFVTCALLSCAVIYYATIGAIESAEIGETAGNAVLIPVWFMKWLAVVGLVALLFQILALLHRLLIVPPEERANDNNYVERVRSGAEIRSKEPTID